MQKHLDAGEVAIRYSPKFREYGIAILDGGSATQDISYCPWCGAALPPSLRDSWFDTLEEMGLEPEDPQIPDELKDDRWWRSR